MLPAVVTATKYQINKKMLQEVALAAMAAQTIISTAAESPRFSLLFPNPTFPSSLSYNLTPQSLPLSLPIAPHPLFIASSTNKAVAIIKGTSSVQGLATLTQDDNGPTTLSVRISGLAPGPHGFHLHQYGDTTNGCISTGPHFNPDGLKHGAPQDEVRHAGDLGNIIANADGVAEATIVDSQIPLTGANAVIGRALVVHELEDDLGKGGQELSLSTGNAGGRLACGVVALSPV